MPRRRDFPTRSLANSSAITGRSVKRMAEAPELVALAAASAAPAAVAEAAVPVGLVAEHQGRRETEVSRRPFSFPSSAWERTGAKLCFAAVHKEEAELPALAFPSRAWERG